MSIEIVGLTLQAYILPSILFRMAFSQGNDGILMTPTVHDDNLGCGRVHEIGERFKDWAECGIYYVCELNDGVYTKKVYQCTKDRSFSQETGKCVEDPSCVDFPPYPENQGDLDCLRDWSMNVHPENCSNFYVCHYTGEYYTLEHHTCIEDVNGVQKIGYFDNRLKKCVNFDGQGCPNDLLSVPPGIFCTDGGQLDRHEYPYDCHMYYQCVEAEGDTFVKVEECETGSFFDFATKQCVEGECENKEPKPLDGRTFCINGNCGGGLPELPDGIGWECSAQDEFHVLPNDCSYYYSCKHCSKGNGWCYKKHDCGTGYRFDDHTKTCNMTETCP